MTKGVLLPMVAAFAGLLLQCSGPTKPASQTDNGSPVITGKLLNPDGKTPAKGALITIRPARSIAGISAALGKTKGEALRSITDTNGVYSISTIAAGTYSAEGADNRGNGARIDSFAVTDTGEPIVLPDDTLKTCGAIRGVIRLDAGGDLREVFVLAFGCDRFAQVRADGSFLLRNMPEGVYDLKVACTNAGYGEYDTASIPVASGDTSDIGVIKMKMLDKYIPTNVTIQYDTVLQRATIRWDTCIGVNVAGYQLYRVDKDSPSTLYDKTPYCSDTSLRRGMFIDSMVAQGHTYVYEVASITGDPGNEQLGSRSAPASFTPYNGFMAIDTLQPPDSLRLRYPLDVASNGRGELACVFKHFNNVTIVWYTAELKLRRACNIDSTVTIAMPEGAAMFCVDEDDNSWFCNSDLGNVMSFDKTGRLRYSVTDSGRVCAFEAFHDTMYIARSGSGFLPDYTVTSCNDANKKLFNFTVNMDTVGAFCIATDGRGSVIAGSNKIWMFTPGGTVKKKIDVGPGVTRFLDASPGGVLAQYGADELRLFNYNGELTARHSLKNVTIGRVALIGNDMFAVVLLEGVLVLKKTKVKI
jgi:hypothetical protein